MSLNMTNKTYEPFLLDPDYISRKCKSRETHFLKIVVILILAAGFLGLFVFFYSQESSNECPSGYQYFQPTDSCYKLHKKIASLQEAQNTCLLENALLESPQENDLLVELFGDDLKHSFICKRSRNAANSSKKRRDLFSATKTKSRSRTKTKRIMVTKRGKTTDYSAVGRYETFGLSVSSIMTLIRGIFEGYIDEKTMELRKTTTDECPFGFDYSYPYCYTVYIDQATFAEANASCASHNAHLVSIHSDEEYQTVKFYYDMKLDYYKRNVWQYEQAAPIWTGLHYDDGWKWTDGSPVDYQNWKISEPKDEANGFDKAFMDISWPVWSSEKGDVKHSYVCKKSPEK